MVSIGMPVYNGENYLEEAILAILGQTFPDFELILSDNVSTDRTREICLDYSAKDRRIRYNRNAENLRSIGNFNQALKLARGKYFKWAAHDDTHAPTFLEKCIGPLEEDPGIVLCYTRTSVIDEHGNVIRNDKTNLRSNSRKPHIRFHDLLVNYWCFEMFGVIRRSAIEGTPYKAFGHSDGVFLATLGMKGRFHEIPEYLFFNRDHPEKSLHLYSSYSGYTKWVDPSKEGKILFPRWRIGFEHCKSIGTIELPAKERMLCYFQMGHWIRIF